MRKYLIYIIMATWMLSSCDDLFSPANQNFKDASLMYSEPDYARGFLTHAYARMPGYYDNSDYATDDAVTNQKSNNFLRVATGSWTADNNPFNRWGDSFDAILFVNLFLDHIDGVNFVNNEAVKELLQTRMKGEAYAMRAYHMYYLLRAHAGYSTDGQLLGVPIILDYLEPTADFNLPRATFEDCLKQIYSDLDEAEKRLPMEYNNLTSGNDIPERFRSVTTDPDLYNRAMGLLARQLCNGLIVQAIRSKVALLAASPAYQDPSNTTTWADAANYAAQVIDYAGGISGLAPTGITYYANISEIEGLSQGSNPNEMIWRNNLSTGNSTQQEQNYPPSLFGRGYMNPTQNLVDAFPMANGYPIDHEKSDYNPADPYANRDPRLSHYIIYNGSIAGIANKVIFTSSNSGTDDGINVKETSTRTGYYMKKRLRMDVNRDPASIVGKTHYDPRIRYTEIFLNYAEAANEAWGPEGKGTHSYSAYDVAKAIRQRAGIGTNNNDPYLESCKTDKDKMRDLIRNERRLELCFEGFRFWDIRRWKQNLNETARGMNGLTVFNVEERSYKDYMYHGPIPYTETLKYNNLIQNKGW